LERRIHEEEIGVLPLGLYYVAALLKEQHYDVEILNWYRIDENPHRIDEILKEKNPDIIGFSIFNANRWGGIEIARIAKKINPQAKVVFGGIGATLLWKHFLSHFPEVDFIVRGEGEYPFLELIRCVEKGEDARLHEIKGIAFRKGEEIIETGEADFIGDLDELPIPSRYFAYAHLSSTRGCPGDCTFCGSPRFWGRKVRFHSPDYFVNQIELLYRQGVTFFYVSDDTFLIKKNRVVDICKKVIERRLKISWVAISRVNHVDEEVLYWMRKAGCIQISYGIESGSRKIRDLLNKHIEEEQIKGAFSLTTKYGILPRAYFIYGCPGESPSTIRETIRLMDEIKPLSVIFYILDLFPGTALFEDAKRRLTLTDDIWLSRVEDILYFETDPALTKEKVFDFGEKLRTAYYERLPRYVEEIELLEREDLSESHADFLSRLAMTFSHGDYSRIEKITDRDRIAEKLFEKALGYYPDHRAFLGLAMVKQKRRDPAGSVTVLTEGIRHYPESESLKLCLGIGLMNMGDYSRALSVLLELRQAQEAPHYISICYRALGQPEKALEFERNPHRGGMDQSGLR
jgi:anaerobic magnesium-protoporphyrin IX monomethyl ester cyclase